MFGVFCVKTTPEKKSFHIRFSSISTLLYLYLFIYFFSNV